MFATKPIATDAPWAADSMIFFSFLFEKMILKTVNCLLDLECFPFAWLWLMVGGASQFLGKTATI